MWDSQSKDEVRLPICLVNSHLSWRLSYCVCQVFSACLGMAAIVVFCGCGSSTERTSSEHASPMRTATELANTDTNSSTTSNSVPSSNDETVTETVEEMAATTSTDSTSHSVGGNSHDVSAQTDSTDPSLFKNSSISTESFVDWPAPLVALFVTGRQHGYIEPCGCTGLANQKGGLARRHTVLETMRGLGWSSIALDVGNQVRRFGKQPEIKYQTTINGLREMKYDVISFGPDDLRLSSDEILAAVIADEEDVPFVVANVDIAGFLPTFRVSEVAGRKIGVTSVLGNSHRDRVTDDDLLSVRDATEALREVRTELVNANCDWYVLLAHASIEESEELARTFPEFDIVVTAGGAGEPTYQPTEIEGSEAVLVQVGTKGMYAGVIGLYEDAAQPIKYQRIALDGSWSDSVTMLRLLAGYQQQLEALQLNGLELHPVVHPSGRQFVGSEKCGECHTKAFDKWVETPHSHATETLVHPPERYEVPRHFDPECLSCHVTGWNAQGYYPYRSGYVELEASQHLRGNGCENCHGPGSQHVAAEEGESDLDDDQLEALRDQMKLAMADAKENCLQCHDIDNSPDFHVEEAFEKEYWPAIEHIGKD